MKHSHPDTRIRSRKALIGLALLTLAACSCSRKDDAALTIVVPGDVNHEAFHALVHARGAAPDAQANVRAFKARPESAMAQSYGADVASALTGAHRIAQSRSRRDAARLDS